MRPSGLSRTIYRRLGLSETLRRAASLRPRVVFFPCSSPKGAQHLIELGVTPTLIQPVILCGGSGTRLWPLSREYHPKPLHALNGEQTLLQETALRLRGVAALGEPLLVCNEAHRFMAQAQLARIGAKPRAILLEPKGRGTAPALTLAAMHMVACDDPVLLAMPSDHVIADRAAFQHAVERGAALAGQGY